MSQGDPRYMMQRSLMLLLSDVRARVHDFTSSVEFVPEFSRKDRLEGTSLLPLVLLVNLWSSISGLCQRVLPRVHLPLAWSQSSLRIEDDFTGDSVDWGETFRRWAIG